jgi:hypothetical protein
MTAQDKTLDIVAKHGASRAACDAAADRLK